MKRLKGQRTDGNEVNGIINGGFNNGNKAMEGIADAVFPCCGRDSYEV